MSHSGVRRPAALWCVDENEQLDIPDYEIALIEPLHDFKNVINRVLAEVPHSVEDPQIKKELTNILNSLRGIARF